MKKHTLTIAILFLWSSSVFPQEPVKYSTKQARELWQICSVSIRKLYPGIGQNIYFPVCDCYLDHIRYNYVPEVMDNMTPTEYNKLSQELRNACNQKLKLKPREEDFT